MPRRWQRMSRLDHADVTRWRFARVTISNRGPHISRNPWLWASETRYHVPLVFTLSSVMKFSET
jgi:hypothetical protein